jgi:hypothetical protein
MSPEIFHYTFDPSVSADELEATLLLTILAAESLHGATQLRLYAAHAFDADRRVCVIDARSDVGRDINRIFAGFVQREFGADMFRVERVEQFSKTQKQE